MFSLPIDDDEICIGRVSSCKARELAHLKNAAHTHQCIKTRHWTAQSENHQPKDRACAYVCAICVCVCVCVCVWVSECLFLCLVCFCMCASVCAFSCDLDLFHQVCSIVRVDWVRTENLKKCRCSARGCRCRQCRTSTGID